jgi:hypothetical protein
VLEAAEGIFDEVAVPVSPLIVADDAFSVSSAGDDSAECCQLQTEDRQGLSPETDKPTLSATIRV